MEENIEMQTTEATTPTEEASAQEATQETSSAPKEGENATADGAQNDTAAEEHFLSIRYNHQDFCLTAEEATRLAQLGKWYEQEGERYANIGKDYEKNTKEAVDALDFVATLQGKSLKDFANELLKGVDDAYREELEADLGRDNPHIEEMLELRRNKNKKTYEGEKERRLSAEKAAQEEAQNSMTTRLAEQFEGLRDIFPELDNIEKIPDTVIKRAMQSGDLEKEMLRYERSERMKVEAAKAAQEKNKKENVGSAHSVPAEDNLISAMMQGIWGR